MANITLNILAENLGNLAKCAEDKSYQLPALKTAEGLMKRRVFNEGKAVDGDLGRYRSNWKKVREKAGRQTTKKDLFFQGDLSRSLTVGKSGEDYVLGFSNSKARLIAEGQENQTGKDIWSLTDAEQKAVAKAAVNVIRKCLQGSFKR